MADIGDMMDCLSEEDRMELSFSMCMRQLHRLCVNTEESKPLPEFMYS